MNNYSSGQPFTIETDANGNPVFKKFEVPAAAPAPAPAPAPKVDNGLLTDGQLPVVIE